MRHGLPLPKNKKVVFLLCFRQLELKNKFCSLVFIFFSCDQRSCCMCVIFTGVLTERYNIILQKNMLKF